MDDLQYLNCNIDALPTGSPPFAGDAATAADSSSVHRMARMSVGRIVAKMGEVGA